MVKINMNNGFLGLLVHQWCLAAGSSIP